MITEIDLRLEYKKETGDPSTPINKTLWTNSDYVRWLERRLIELSPIAYLKDHFTCVKCEDNEKCEFAFDLYNMDGDCLAIK